ncbi:class I SAM-dependent methyltransferase [Neobacillus sp. D3-1R]|uniref:class I SAM-dependent methyltransferase n=1 Tax=Neobacillus sp. D3-1R TaxID=3445778 RepID=UPI003F9EFE52
MFVTTAGRTNQVMIEQAKMIAEDLDVPFIDRKKRSVALMQKLQNDACMVVGKERLELFPFGEPEPFFFHPNSAMFRIKRLQRGEHDPFVDACQLKEGMSFLDCTLGLASDSIVASFSVGPKGKVIGLEAEKYLSYIVREGLKKWDAGISEMDEAMRQIEVIHAHCFDYMKSLPNNSVDVVYFDPMFEESILESDGIKALTHLAVYEKFQAEWMEEALRVSKCRVVLKDHYQSERFEQFGFLQLRRKTAKFHFGILEK